MAELDPAEREAAREARKEEPDLQGPDRDRRPGTGAKHFVFPMTDAFTIRRVAGVVNALGSEFDALSRRQDLPLRLLALSLKDAVNAAKAEIRRLTGADPGREQIQNLAFRRDRARS